MYVFNADLWCDACGRHIAETDSSLIDTGDSDDFPQYAPEGETDSPGHCASGRDCLEPEDLGCYGLAPGAVLVGAESRLIGGWLGEDLTEHGREYLAELLAEPDPTPYQAALHAFWREVYGVA